MEQKCIFKSSIWRVFEVFVNDPLKLHYIKEISRKIKLAPTSVKKHLEDLQKQEIIIKKKGERFFGYVANRDNEDFLFYKKTFNFINLRESGLIDFIKDSLYPKTIILYGSYLRGEDVGGSDVDLFVLTEKKKKLDFEKFEKILKRPIHAIIENGLKKLNKNLRLELSNGLILYGFLKNG